MNILCALGIHKWREKREFEPSFTAPIVTRMYMHRTCEICGKFEVICDHHFEEKTGVPIDI